MLRKEIQNKQSPEIEKASSDNYSDIMDVWESSVKATHHFLKPEDFELYKKIIPTDYLPMVDLYVLREKGNIVGFLGIAGENLEMLFLAEHARGKGYGKILLDYAIKNFNINKLDVNEQNLQAVGFYKKQGFKITGRSEKDSMNKNYPVLHLSL